MSGTGSSVVIVPTLVTPACADKGGDSGEPANIVADFGDDTPLPEILDNESFYQISSSSWEPDEAWLAAWSLTINDGKGGESIVSLADLAALGGTRAQRTISCIGSSSGYTMGNAEWTSIRLDALLSALGLAPSGDWILFTSGDGYSTCLPRSDLDLGLALAWEMNGVALPADHGAPLRVLTPGRYGQKNPKWLEKIEFIADYVDGFWESRGWSDDASYQVSSWFLEPREYTEVSHEGAWIKGCAFAGETTITRVELSDDGGKSWQEAEITYAGGPGIWALWRFAWTPPTLGDVEIMVRATTADGRVQADAEPADNDRDGYEGTPRFVYIVV